MCLGCCAMLTVQNFRNAKIEEQERQHLEAIKKEARKRQRRDSTSSSSSSSGVEKSRKKKRKKEKEKKQKKKKQKRVRVPTFQPAVVQSTSVGLPVL